MFKNFTNLFFLGAILSYSSSCSKSSPPPVEPVTKTIVQMANIPLLPKNFRSSREGTLPCDASPFLFQGFETLNASASAQFSKESLKKIQEVINREKVIIFDLRQESHGFVNGIPVTWRSPHNWSNIGKHLDSIQRDENEKLLKALAAGRLLIHESTFNHLNVEEVATEEELVLSQGLSYKRLPTTDHCHPTDHVVDLFVKTILECPPDTWVHFHCSGGKGRATTFMAMLDMMRNAKHVSFENIILRQHLIGGVNLCDPKREQLWKIPYVKQRIEFLKQFYKYCVESNGFQEIWSSWRYT